MVFEGAFTPPTVNLASAVSAIDFPLTLSLYVAPHGPGPAWWGHGATVEYLIPSV
jgi:hypothetical protein